MYGTLQNKAKTCFRKPKVWKINKLLYQYQNRVGYKINAHKSLICWYLDKYFSIIWNRFPSVSSVWLPRTLFWHQTQLQLQGCHLKLQKILQNLPKNKNNGDCLMSAKHTSARRFGNHTRGGKIKVCRLKEAGRASDFMTVHFFGSSWRPCWRRRLFPTLFDIPSCSVLNFRPLLCIISLPATATS